MSKFEAGKTYQTRSPVDSDCVIRETIAKRTAKSVTTASGKTFRITEWDGVETFREEYDANSGADLLLMQEGKISYSEWNRRQSAHCDKYYSARHANSEALLSGGAA